MGIFSNQKKSSRKIISNHLHIVSIMIANNYPYVKRYDEPYGNCVIRIV